VNIEVRGLEEGGFSPDQWFLKAWRVRCGQLSLRQLAEATSLSIGNLSQWENGLRVPDIDDLARLDDFYRAGGALISLAQAGRLPCPVLPARERWSSNFGCTGPVWVWLRAPVGSQGIRATLRWGVLSGSAVVSEEGWIVSCPVSTGNPPLRVTFTAPGLAHFGTGRIPRALGIPVVAGIDLARFIDLRDSSLSLFRGPLGTLLGRRLNWVAEIVEILRHRHGAVGTMAAEAGRKAPLDLTALLEPPPQRQPAIALSPDQYRELRISRCLTRASAARIATEQFPPNPVLDREIKSLELGSEPRLPHLRSRLDRLYEADGVTVFERCPVVNLAAGIADISFPTYWRGPVWLLFYGLRPAQRATLKWGPWQKRLIVKPNLPVTFRFAGGDTPLRVLFEPSWELASGLGVYRGAADVNEDWEPVDETAGIELFHEYKVVYLGLFQRSKEQFAKLMRLVGGSSQ